MNSTKGAIPVIDIFAGPGGLGEGFASFRKADGRRRFDVKLSIEKDEWAVATLSLRAFLRKFDKMPEAMCHAVRAGLNAGAITQAIEMHPHEAAQTKQEVWRQTLARESVEETRKRIRGRIGKDERWVLVGGPPCQAYSLAGRSRNRGNKEYVAEKDHRHTLYEEYLQVIADHRPHVFVMENVKGLLSSTLNSTRMFQRIVEDLQSPAKALERSGRKVSGRQRPRYRIVALVNGQAQDLFGRRVSEGSPENFIVRAERFGIPQARHRVFLVGLLEGAELTDPACLTATESPSVEETIRGLPGLRSGLTDRSDTADEWLRLMRNTASAPWIVECEETVQKRIRHILKNPRLPEAGLGGAFLPCDAAADEGAFRWGGMLEGGVANHFARRHMGADLERYLFASVWAKQHGRSPAMIHFPKRLLPQHKNVEAALKGGHWSDRFRVQVSSRPATTIMSHLSKDGHYYIHYDAKQCRSLSVREAARLQTFPDDYIFLGPPTAQREQVGNAVPPFLARQIAKVVSDIL